MYHYRNLPCSIQPDSMLWCVSGHDEANNSSGVLEWCYDELDAHRTLRDMRADRGRFSNLRAHKYMEGRDRIKDLCLMEQGG